MSSELSRLFLSSWTNLPFPPRVSHQIVKVNDGNDSSNHMEEVITATKRYVHKFFNTANPNHLAEFPDPVVLTCNPGKKTDTSAYLLPNPPPNLMYVRFRVNAWNLDLADKVVQHYTKMQIPVVMTFMAYFTESVPKEYQQHYIYRKRTTNVYWAITTKAFREIMKRWEDNLLVSSCGKIEGANDGTKCRYCGVCLREYFATLERLDPWEDLLEWAEKNGLRVG